MDEDVIELPKARIKLEKGYGSMNGNSMGQGFKKGCRGNPGGRPATIAGIIAKATKNGKELAEFQLAVMRGKIKVEMEMDGRKIWRYPSIADRQKACDWLSDRGFGKVDQNINGQVSLVNVGLTFPEFRRVLPEPAIDVSPIGETEEIGQKANESVVSASCEHTTNTPNIEKDAPERILEPINSEPTAENLEKPNESMNLTNSEHTTNVTGG